MTAKELELKAIETGDWRDYLAAAEAYEKEGQYTWAASLRNIARSLKELKDESYR